MASPKCSPDCLKCQVWIKRFTKALHEMIGEMDPVLPENLWREYGDFLWWGAQDLAERLCDEHYEQERRSSRTILPMRYPTLSRKKAKHWKSLDN